MSWLDGSNVSNVFGSLDAFSFQWAYQDVSLSQIRKQLLSFTLPTKKNVDTRKTSYLQTPEFLLVALRVYLSLLTDIWD